MAQRKRRREVPHISTVRRCRRRHHFFAARPKQGASPGVDESQDEPTQEAGRLVRRPGDLAVAGGAAGKTPGGAQASAEGDAPGSASVGDRVAACRSDQYRWPVHGAGLRSSQSGSRVDRRRGRRRLGEHEMPAVAGSSSGAPTDLSKSAPSPSIPRMPRPSTAAPVRRICRPTPIRATVCTGRPMAA